MKKSCLFLVFCLYFVCTEQAALRAQAGQDIPLPGIVVRQNSRKADGSVDRISGVDLRARKAIPTQSDAQGQFTLLFSDVPPGNTVRIQADRIGMEVVNQTELENAAVLGRTAPLKVVMCPKGQLYENQVRYYEIAESEILKRYERRRKILETKGKAQETLIAQLRTELATEISGREEALQLLTEQKEAALAKANELSNQFARVNLDDASELYRKAFAFFQAGDIDQALGYLRSANLPALVEQILEEERRLVLLKEQVVERDSLKDLRKKEAKEGIQLQLDLYESLSRVDSVLVCYELLVRVDTGDVDNLINFGSFLSAQRLNEKAANVLQQAAERVTDTVKLINIWCYIGNDMEYFDKAGAIESFLKAEKIWEQYQHEAEEVAEDDWLTLLIGLYSSMGRVYRGLGDNAKSEEYCLKSVKVNESDFAKKYGLTIDFSKEKFYLLAAGQLNLAQVYTANKEYEKAEAYILNILDQNSAVNDSTETSNLIDLMGNMFLAEVYMNNSQPDKAEPTILRMLEITESDSILDAQIKFLALMTLTEFYKGQHKYVEAEKCINQLIEIYSDSKDNQTNEINLAAIYQYCGDFYSGIAKYSECIEPYKKCCEIYMRHFEDNPNLFGPNAARVALKAGESLALLSGLYMQADSFFNMAERIYNRLEQIGPTPLLKAVIANLYSLKGKSLVLQGDQRAEQVLNKARDLFLEAFQADTASLFLSLSNIEADRALLYANSAQFELALATLKQSSNLMVSGESASENAFKHWHGLAKTMFDISNLFIEMEQIDSAFLYRKKGAEYLEKAEAEVPGRMTEYLIDAYDRISKYEYLRSDYENARIGFQKALNMIQRLEPLSDPVMIEWKIKLLTHLGSVLVSRSDLEAADFIKQSEQLIAGNKKYDQWHAKNLENLAVCYLNLGLFPDSLEIWAQQALELTYKLDTLYPGTDDIDIPRTLRILAYIQLKTQNYTQALANYQKSNELGSMNATDNYGVNNCEKIANTCYLIVLCFQNLNQPDSAIHTLKTNYAYLQNCPFQHDHSADFAYNLLKQMRLQYSVQRPDSAYAAGNRAIAHYENLLSRDTTAFAAYLAEAYNTTGVLGLEKEDPNQTMRYFERAAVLYTHIAPLDTQAIEPELAQVYHNIGYLYLATELPQRGIPFTIEAINLRKKYFPESVKGYVQSINQLLLSCTGICPDSLLRVYLLEALQILAESDIDSNESLKVKLQYHNRLGGIYSNEGNCIASMYHFRRAAEVYQIVCSIGVADSANYGIILANLGERYLACGDIPSADSCLNAAFQWFEMLETKHPGAYKNLLAKKIPDQSLRYYTRKRNTAPTLESRIEAQKSLILLGATILSEIELKDTSFARSLAEEASYLSWGLLQLSRFAEAEQYSRQALLFSPTYLFANMNLAYSLMLQPGKEQEGLVLCRKYADEPYPYEHEAGNTFRDVFLDDFRLLRKAGISCPAFEEAEQFLRK